MSINRVILSAMEKSFLKLNNKSLKYALNVEKNVLLIEDRNEIPFMVLLYSQTDQLVLVFHFLLLYILVCGLWVLCVCMQITVGSNRDLFRT